MSAEADVDRLVAEELARATELGTAQQAPSDPAVEKLVEDTVRLVSKGATSSSAQSNLELPAAAMSDHSTFFAPDNNSAPLTPRDSQRSSFCFWGMTGLGMLALVGVAATYPTGGPSTTAGLAMSTGSFGITIPTRPLTGGGTIPMLMMGGDDFLHWFRAAGRGAGIQTFYSYGNGEHIAEQLAKVGRENVFVSAGIPCGCCKYDAPKVKVMNKTMAMWYIDEELAQLGTSTVDLLLFHHRCKTDAETASVWEAFEEAKQQGKARHIGVSNFNKHDLATLLPSTKLPIEVLEAHFGVGVMDFETLAFARQHSIHPVAFSSLSELSTDHPTLRGVVDGVAAAHGISTTQAMMAYVHNHNLTVLSSCFHAEAPEKCVAYYEKDFAIFDVRLTPTEMAKLDAATLGKRTCTDCFTDECQACAAALDVSGCPLGMSFPIWGRSNRNGTLCQECAARPENTARIQAACGSTARGESLETMVPKACGI